MSPTTEAPRVAKITADDHGGLVTIAAALGLTYMVLCFVVKIYIRWSISGRFGSDDAALALATLVGLGQSIVVLTGVAEGFGKSLALLDSQHLLRLEKLAYTGDILLVLTLCLSKCSVILLLAGLTRNVNHNKACKVILGLSATWGIASVLALALRCELSHPWLTTHEYCTYVFLRWQLIAVFDAITEAALVSMAIYLVWSLQMSIKSKATVVSAFTFRLPLILLACLRLHYLAVAYASPNPTFDAVPASILTQIQLSYSIISATIPCLKPYMRACNTGFLGGPVGGRHGSSSTSAGSYALQSISSNKAGTAGNRQHPNRKVSRPAQAGPSTVVTHAPSRSRREDAESVESGRSEQLIVRRPREWIVDNRFEGGAGGGSDGIARAA